MVSSNSRDPLGIRQGARFVAGASAQVDIDHDALAAYCRALAEHPQFPRAEWESEFHFAGEQETTVAYVFILDTVNFCFWGDPKWRRPHGQQWLDGYWALAAALTQELSRDPGSADPHNLAQVDAEGLARVLDGVPTIPLLGERAENLRELGHWVVTRFGGRFSNVVQEAGYDAIQLVRMVLDGL
ncbi:MAG: queuosine salvage family protein, partial [Anaerolineae bacterium]|nr:queuosine salvage family protein [Anaerolineae bacterium]